MVTPSLVIVGRAELLVEDDVAALRAEGDLDRVGDRVDAGLERLARLSVVLQFLVSHVFLRSPYADLGEDVGLAQHEQLLAVDLDLGPAVLAVEDLVALLDVQRDALAVLVELAVADGEDLALLRLLLGGVGEHEATGGGLLLLDRPHDQTIAQGLELHVRKTSI